MKLTKPKFWDQKKPNLTAYLLFPFTIFITLNNFFLKIKSKKIYKEIKTICVGNIYLGGTGKTPTVLKIYQLLKNDLNVVTAKKFYIDQEDEQIILKDKSKFLTYKNREEIIKNSIKQNLDLIIFDDGLQDNNINYNLNFVCFDSQNWIGNGCLIPSGPLREKLTSLEKYDAVFIKFIEEDTNLEEIYSTIKKINPKIKIFNSLVQVKDIDKFDLTKKYVVFSGIGNAKSFKSLLLKNNFNVIKEIIFPDHHNYKINEIENILKKTKELGAKLITTEKDFVKLHDNYKNQINFLEIELKIIEESKLIQFIKSKIYETN
tara:strand:- start:3296 stop:4249 length:954 start_codon:yes stop_codon:yes gene_type:complete